MDEFFAAGAADLTNPQHVHQMRIAGKKLRYAIELLATAFDASLREELYPQFTQIQEDLGQINDHAVAKNLFDGWLVQSDDPATDDELARLVTQEQLALQSAMDRFRKAWTPQLCAADARPVPGVAGAGAAREIPAAAAPSHDASGGERLKARFAGHVLHPAVPPVRQ